MSDDVITLRRQDLTSLLTLNGLFNLLGKDLNEIVNFLRFMPDEKSSHLIEVYDSLSAREKNKLDLDKLAERAGLSNQTIRAMLISALVEYQIDCSALLLSLYMPEVVKKTIQSALGDGEESFEDREMLMQHWGLRTTDRYSKRW